MPSKIFTDNDIANLLLTEENNSEGDLWSDYEGSEDENKEITAHEDDSDYEGEEEVGEGGGNGHDDSDVTGSGGNEIIIRGNKWL
jgi:hypothetical protein